MRFDQRTAIYVLFGPKSHAVAAAAAAATALHISISAKLERKDKVQLSLAVWLKPAPDNTACHWRPR